MALRSVLSSHSIDDDTIEYLSSIVFDITESTASAKKSNYLRAFVETLTPFLESYNVDNTASVCKELNRLLGGADNSNNNTCNSKDVDDVANETADDLPKLLDKSVILGEKTKNYISESEKNSIDTLWGFDKIREKKNDTIGNSYYILIHYMSRNYEYLLEMTEAGSAKYERKAMKEQRKWLEELENKFVGEEDEGTQISTMLLPDFSGNSRDKDIQVNNITITYGGSILLDGADLRIVYGRRYGLIGRNGVGKTTLLKHMARREIEGFPKHHRILHVKQEVRSSDESVLQVVLNSDVERMELMKREKELLEKQRKIDSSDNSGGLQMLMDELNEVYERMSIIGATSAESRAAVILTGLGFNEEMQRSSTDSLSGGWRMRVALAGALFIEPDLLMLDEPTNHLDLEAVLWLQTYLQTYPHTVLLVSHDKAFLNEVCTDIILFKKLKLLYFKGNYDLFDATYKEQQLVQQRQHEAQMVKVQHMQEFVDKFRYNAKRASLVQSRIKAIERETVVEAVEDEEKQFTFNFIDSGELGRPVIQIEGVTFGYSSSNILFKNVHLGIEQSSRIALVGPNGAGKSTLLNLIQNKLTPLDGYIHVNAQLRLGIFTQHHLDSFDLNVSPLQNMLNRWPKALEADLRGHLGRYDICGNDALKPMKFSSGGQKSRAAFACLTYSKPHVVILDEPTNHLDMGTIEALADALVTFSGGVLVVSHDQHFIQRVCKEIWIVDNKQVTTFDGDFNNYKKFVLGKK